MRIYLAADHAGFQLKEQVKAWLKGLGYEVHDEGAFELEPEDDYPDFMHIVGRQVASDPDNHRGLVFGGSGQGEAIVANRYPGVRAAVYYGSVKVAQAEPGASSEDIITLSRTHNNANVLSIGARFVGEAEALKVIKLWLETEFGGDERHVRRLGKIDEKPTEDHEF